MFTIPNAPEGTGYRDLMTILGRTGSFQWGDLGLHSVPPELDGFLSYTPSEMRDVATGLSLIHGRLEAGYGSAPPPRSAEPPAQAGWVRATAVALRPFPELSARCAVTAPQLSDLVDRDTVLRAIQLYAGRIKDGAMDTRLFLGGFGWYLLSLVMQGLREAVAGLPQAEAEEILSPFAPMLVVMGQIMEDRDERRRETKTKTEKLAAEVEEATAEKDRAEAALKLRGEPKVPRKTLKELALKEETPPPPRRRTRR